MDQIKDDFLANTSHELRTPLNGIIGLAEAMGRANLSDQDRRDLDMIVSSGRRLSRMVNDVLDFAKMRHQDISLEMRSVDSRVAVDAVVALSQPLVGDKDLQITNHVEELVPAVFADEDRLMQVLHNLVGNAIKFTHRGSIDISATVVDDSVRFSVRDSGIGIDSDKLDSVFESFTQADSSISREYGGTGLGLPICRALVQRMGGSMAVESTPGVGSVFSFSLTIAPTEANPDAGTKAALVLPPSMSTLPAGVVGAVPSNKPPEAKIAGVPGEQRVLVVDDEGLNRTVVRRHLESIFCRVDVAADGFEALEHIEANGIPDLLLLDLMMPKMSGIEICQRLRNEYLASRLPIVILTAKNQVTDFVEAFDAGASDWLTKPFSREELLLRVRYHLRMQRESAERARLEQKLAENVKSLEHFAHASSHDLQQPLRTIQVLVSIIENEYAESLEGDLGEQFSRIRLTANRMTELIRGLRDYTGILSGLSKLTSVDLGELLNNVQSDLDALTRETGGSICINSELPVVVGDRAQTYQLFLNLCANALKYHRQDVPPVVQITARRFSSGHEIEIADNGIGIDDKYRDRIFEPFKRLHAHDEYSGSGIGLSVCQKIVTSHGWTIRVDSVPGEGSTFIVSIPDHA